MATRIDVPQLGLTMETGTILQWLVAEGAAVEKGQPVVLIQTDKVEYEVEAPVAGTLLKIAATEGAELPVGSVMGVLGQPGEDVTALLGAPPAPATPTPAPAAAAAGPAPSAAAPAGGRIKASPVAKKLAQEHGLDLATLAGTGPDGRIVREDVERAIAAKGQTARPATADAIPLSGIRKVIFDRMGQSAREAARVTLFAEADVTALSRLRQAKGAAWEQRFGVKPSYSDLLHLAVARALRAAPRINCRLEGQSIRVLPAIHLGFAVDLGEGLVAVVIRDADRKGLGELTQAARALTARARAGTLAPDDLAEGTFTVTNLGGYGVAHFTPIINQPQAGILGVGKIREGVVVKEGGLHVRSLLPLSLAFDHRLLDGAPAAKFLATLIELLEQPDWIE